MNEDFITYESAKKLKEKGFDWQTFDWYDMAGNFCKGFMPRELMCREYYAPTISQVLKWLREEKLILIGLSPMQEYGGDEVIEWCSTVYKADKQGGLSWQEEFYYQSYEQAALAGIEYVLGNLI